MLDDATSTGVVVRKPPGKETAVRDTSVRAAGAIGIWVRRAIGTTSPFQGRSATNTATTLASWHEFCGWVKATCSPLVISMSYVL
jgi:hypothetical protein